MKRKAGGELKDQRNDWEGGAERKRRKAAPTFRKKERGAARYSPYRQRLRPSAPGSLRREFIGADSATCIRYPARLNLRPQRWPLRSLWLNPALCSSPVYRRGAKSHEQIVWAGGLQPEGGPAGSASPPMLTASRGG